MKVNVCHQCQLIHLVGLAELDPPYTFCHNHELRV